MNFNRLQRYLRLDHEAPRRNMAELLRCECGGSAPAPPDPNQAAVAGQAADVSNFPSEWAVNTAAQTGGKVNVDGQTYDFGGLSNADAASKVSSQTAQALLDIQNNYGPAYIKQRLADLQQSDPAGYAAYQQLFDRIQTDATTNPDRPMAADLQNQVQTMLSTSGQLDANGTRQVQNQVRAGQALNGITLGNEPAAQESTALVGASDNLRASQQQQAESYLGSGVSPQDVTYRRIQQSLANLGAFQNGQTPTAEFGQLSGAQSQAAPQTATNYSTPASLNPGASSAEGLNFANSLYGQTSQFQNQQANPWLSGLTTGVNALSTAGQLGYSPWSPAPTYNTNPAGQIASSTATNNSLYGVSNLGPASGVGDFNTGTPNLG